MSAFVEYNIDFRTLLDEPYLSVERLAQLPPATGRVFINDRFAGFTRVINGRLMFDQPIRMRPGDRIATTPMPQFNVRNPG